jgi:intein/homing endonuclease
MDMNWDYIAGFFDGEGNVHYMKRKSGSYAGRIGITQSDTESLDEIKKFLNKNKIDCGVYKNHPDTKIASRLVINGYWDVIDFLKNIREKVIVKRNKINEVIKNMEEHPVKQTKLRSWQENEVETLMKNKTPYKEIIKKMNLKSTMAIQRIKKQRNIPNYKGHFEA